MAVLNLEPKVLVNVEGPFDAVWKILGEQSSLLNFGTNGQSKAVLPGEEVISDGTNEAIINPAWEFKEDESLLITHNYPIKHIKEFCEITDKTDGDFDQLKFIKYYRCSIDKLHWGEWCSFDSVPQYWNWLDDFYVEFKYIAIKNPDAKYRVEPDEGWSLFLFWVSINGVIVQERTEEKVVLKEPGQCAIVSPDDKWKVFDLVDFVVVAGGITPDRTISINFRSSTTSGRIWTPWLPLNKDNLRTLDLDPLRFWFFEAQFCREGDDASGTINVYDIHFIGDFQNVTDNYSRMGKMGMRSDCLYEYNDKDPNDDNCDLPSYPPKEWDKYECDVRFDNKWDPYDLKATELYKKFTEDVNRLFGWDTVYYKTDPDQQGRDVVLHEYSLSHVIAEANVRVMVDKNQFPDNTVIFTPFDLEMFNVWEVQITRDEFKRVFGIEERPRKWDRIFMCETNRLYQVDHAQAHKDFLNTSVFYTLTLRKAQDNLNVKATPEIQQSLDTLTENNSLDALFDQDVVENVESVSDKEEQQLLTRDETRRIINPYVRIVDDPIVNGPNVISKNYYDFANVSTDDRAITYTIADNEITKGMDRTFIFWFNLKSKKAGVKYDLLTNQEVINDVPFGYRFAYSDSRIDVEWGDQFFEWFVQEVQVNHWYALVALMDQRQGRWTYELYRRKSDINPRSYNDPELVLINTDTDEMNPVEWNIPGMDTVIHGSEMKMTNIRVFRELINKNDIQMILSQYIIRESGKLVFADNAAKKMHLPAVEYRSREARNI